MLQHDDKTPDELISHSTLTVNSGEQSPLDRDREMKSYNFDSEDSNNVTNLSTSIRSSRRRIKGSSVVLNSDKMKKYVQQNDADSTLRVIPEENPIDDKLDSKKERKKLIIEHLKQIQLDGNSPIVTPPQSNVPTIPNRVNYDNFAQKLQSWWKGLIVFRIAKFTLFHKWSMHQSLSVFSLILGHRVRWLMRSVEVKKQIVAIRDVHECVADLLQQQGLVSATTGTAERLHFIDQFVRDVQRNNVRVLSLIPGSDHLYLKSLCKQLSSEREKLYALFFGRQSAVWSRFPAPGHWDLSGAIKHALARKLLTKQQHHHSASAGAVFMSPPRAVRAPNADTQETPPNFRNRVGAGPAYKPLLHKPVNRHNDHVVSDDAVAGSGAKQPPMALTDLLSSEQNLFATPPPRSSALHHKSLSTGGGASLHSHSGVSGLTASTGEKTRHHVRSSITITHGSSPKSTRKRVNSRPHIQLDILSADKLMPAKKGGTARDMSGEPLPDRIPCLKVTLLLPPWAPGNTSSYNSISVSEMKKAFHETRDFEKVTLNPRWGATFCVNLPCTKSMIQALLPASTINALSVLASISQEVSAGDDGDEEAGGILGGLSPADYEHVCRELLQWYAHGVLNVEVFDGERFNEEIFIGHLSVLLSGLNLQIRRHEYQSLEIVGAFQLEKLKPANRVSGSVKLHLYLHTPEKSFVDELLCGANKLGPPSRTSSANKLASGKRHQQKSTAKLGAHSPGDDSSSDRENERNESADDSNPSPPIRKGVSSNTGAEGPVFSSNFMKALTSSSKRALRQKTDGTPGEERVVVGSAAPRRHSLNAYKTTASTAHYQDADLITPHLEESSNIYMGHQKLGTGAVGNRSSLKTVQHRANPPQHTPSHCIGSVQASVPDSAMNTSASNTGASRRFVCEDISKLLAGLSSSVAHSTDEMLDNYTRKLNEKNDKKVKSQLHSTQNIPPSVPVLNNYTSAPKEVSPSISDRQLLQAVSHSVNSAIIEDDSESAPEEVEEVEEGGDMFLNNTRVSLEDEDMPEMCESDTEDSDDESPEQQLMDDEDDEVSETGSAFSFHDEVLVHPDEGLESRRHGSGLAEEEDWHDLAADLLDLDSAGSKSKQSSSGTKNASPLSLDDYSHEDESFSIGNYVRHQHRYSAVSALNAQNLSSHNTTTADDSRLSGVAQEEVEVESCTSEELIVLRGAENPSVADMFNDDAEEVDSRNVTPSKGVSRGEKFKVSSPLARAQAIVAAHKANK